MNIMGTETPSEEASRLVRVKLADLLAELAENANQPRNELDGWDHKREYRRLRNLVHETLKLARRLP